MSEIKGLRKQYTKEPSAADIAIVTALLDEKTAKRYMGASENIDNTTEPTDTYVPTADLLDAVSEATKNSKEYETNAEITKRLWMVWADKEGIDKEDIEEKATFHQDGTVTWEGNCNWGFVTSLPPQLVEVTGYLDLRGLTTLEAGATLGDVGGYLDLDSLTTLEAGAIAGNVGGHLYLRSLTTLEVGAIAGDVGGYLILPELTILEAGAIAGDVGENVYLSAKNFSSEKQEEVKALYPRLRFVFE